MRLTLMTSVCLLLAGCSCKAGLGESCDTTSDCDDDLICVEGKCDDSPAPDAGPEPDGGTDAGEDAGPIETIEDIPIAEEIALEGLEGPVDVVIDQYGIPHVYATTAHDATLAEGYMLARDRFVQLELGRRQASGRLAELFSIISSSVIEDDIYMRVIGLRRQAQAAWDAVQPGSDMETALLGYASGVNGFIERLRQGEAQLPAGLSFVLPTSAIEDWGPVDSLVMGQLQSYSLGYDGTLDADWAGYYERLATTFDQGSSDPELAARAGAAQDLSRLAPSLRVSIQDGRLDQELDAREVPRLERPRLSAAVQAAAHHSQEISRRIARRWGRGSDYGSNNWIISGSLTASGAPIMSNDTHLSLSNPPIFYQVHLNTARNGTEGDPINAAGDTFAGVPGIILGFNENVAWGATTAYFDSTDNYAEVLTPGAGGAPTTVLFDGAEVDVQIVHEEVGNGVGGTVGIDIEWVPHHGPLAPIIEGGELLPHTDPEAISIRWTGFDVLTDPSARKLFEPFVAAIRAANVHDFDAAWDDFGSAPHNWVVADTAGNILWTTKSRMPVRDPVAMTFDPSTGEGLAPCFVLPGTGEAEWTGLVPLDELPHLENPERGYVSNGNNDQTGHTFDGNPFDADPFLGWSYGESGANRAFRIDQRLSELVEAGGITVENLQSVQGDHRSNLGTRIVPYLLGAMDRASQEAATPGTHPDLADAVAAAGEDWPTIEGLADRLAAWTFEAAAGVEDADAAEVEESIATSVFNVTVVELVERALADEYEAAEIDPAEWKGEASRTLLAMIEHPDTLVAVQDGESILWDDLRTPSVIETRDAILVSSLVASLETLIDLLGDDENEWRWGLLHGIRLGFVAGLLPSIPADDDPAFPNGFPRPGDNYTVDASSPGLEDFDFTYEHGPAIRTVVEMLPDGARGVSVIPGGQSSDPESPHYSDEMELWRHNQAHPFYIDEAGVVAAHETRLHLVPN